MIDIELYLEDMRVDLDERFDFPLNKVWNRLENPSDYINEYSKTIKLPRTKNNDLIFGHIYDMNQQSIVRDVFSTISVSVSGGTYIGTTYNTGISAITPLRKRLQVLDSGDNVVFEMDFNDITNYKFTKKTNYNTLRFKYITPVAHIGERYVDLDISGLTDNQDYVLNFNNIVTLNNWSLRFDSLTTTQPNIGLFFQPSRKVCYKIVMNGEIMQEGYAKIVNIRNCNNGQCYEINLFGKMGEVFQELQKVTLNPNADVDDKYKISNPIPDISVDRTTVAHSFNTPQDIINIDDSGITYTDWVGFFPGNRGLYDDFDSKQVEIDNEVKSFVDILPFPESVGNAIVFDGLNEQCYREYRSYYQKPYIYCNKLFQLLIKKYEEINPNVSFQLDTSFFNSSNPYWKDLVMCCDYLDRDEKDRELNTYQNKIYSGSTIRDIEDAMSFGYTTKNFRVQNDALSENIPPLTYNAYSFTISETKKYTYHTDLNMIHYIPLISHTTQYITEARINENNEFVFVVGLWDYDNSKWVNNQTLNYKLSDFATNYKVVRLDNGDLTSDTFMKVTTQLPLSFAVIPPFTGHIGLRVSGSWADNTKGKGEYKFGGIWYADNFSKTEDSFVTISDPEMVSLTELELNNKRSYSKVNIKDLVGVDFNLYDFFIRYIKAFGLVVDYDVRSNTIKVMTRNTYFKNYTITDWTDKLDRSNNFEITPVTFDSQYVTFDYEDADKETTYYSKYKDNYGVNYGGLKLNTDYEFNTDTTDILKEGYKPTIMSIETCLNWDRLAVGEVKKEFTNELMPALYKIDGENKKDVSYFGNYAFRNKVNRLFNSNLRQARITDDSDTMIKSNSYNYIGNSEQGGWVYPYSIMQYEYPDINTISDLYEDYRYGCLWNRPAEVYYRTDDNEENVRYIYDVAWDRYIRERYSNKNKKLTADFNLSDSDYFNFKFNNFISLENRLYFVNKISDYNVSTNDTTKVELIQVNDLNAYTDGQLYLDVEYMDIYNPNLRIISDVNEDTFTVIGNNFPVTFDKPDWLDIEEVAIVGNSHIYQAFGNEEYTDEGNRIAEITMTDNRGFEYQLQLIQEPVYLNLSTTAITLGFSEGSTQSVSVNSSHPYQLNEILPIWLKCDVLVNPDKPNYRTYRFTTLSASTASRSVTLTFSSDYQTETLIVTQEAPH